MVLKVKGKVREKAADGEEYVFVPSNTVAPRLKPSVSDRKKKEWQRRSRESNRFYTWASPDRIKEFWGLFDRCSRGCSSVRVVELRDGWRRELGYSDSSFELVLATLIERDHTLEDKTLQKVGKVYKEGDEGN